MRLPGSARGMCGKRGKREERSTPTVSEMLGFQAEGRRRKTALRGAVRSFGLVVFCCVLALAGVVLASSPGQAATTTVVMAPEGAQASENRNKEEESKNAKPDIESKLEKRREYRVAEKIFVTGYHGIHGLISGMPSGSGFPDGFGVGYTNGRESEKLRFDLNFRISYRLWKSFEAKLLFPTPRSGSPVSAFFRTIYEDYTFKGPSFRTGLRLWPHRRFQLTGLVGYLNPEIDPGDRSPSLETTFNRGGVPGFNSQPDFLLYGGEIHLNFYDKNDLPLGGGVRFGAERYQDRGDGNFDFTRLYGEATASIPLGNRARRLALRFRTSHSLADDGSEVPFYLMEYLGGSSTIRAYAGRRFLDTRNLLANIEYRWEVWHPVDFCVFVDTGKVFHRRDDFDFSDLKTGYGIGLRVRYKANHWFRIDLGHGSEGYRIQASTGPTF
jgi:hypothetical protein